jgi:hypothetical protein
MTALSADPRLDARAFEVGFTIAQHVNKESGIAILSDETICDKTGIPGRWIRRARADLRICGWIDWKRTKTANIYWTRGEQINAVMDHQILLKECREEKRAKLRTARQVRPPVADLNNQDRPPVADLTVPDRPPVANRDRPPVANRDRPPVADIHLSDYTLVDTPSQVLSSSEGFSEEEQHREARHPSGAVASDAAETRPQAYRSESGKPECAAELQAVRREWRRA